MKVAIAILVLVAGCAGRGDRSPEHVPIAYRDVASSLGHTAHVGKVACSDCHGERGFAPPPLEVCSKCHAVITPLHPGMHAPHCQDCHAFGATPIAKDDCMRCHDKPQFGNPAVDAHSDVKCSECHDPHRTPQKVECVRCHDDRQTRHAGTHGCRDCHSIHETRKLADDGCVRCHAKQTGAAHIGPTALTTGHVLCTQCHRPHKFDPPKCADCHQTQPVLAQTKHDACTNCHQPHDDTPKTCVTCHAAVTVKHPTACAGCHPIHATTLDGKKAVTCESCHIQPGHATAKCLDCHSPHADKPVAKCASCHATEAATAPAGHDTCTKCHVPHDPKRPRPACSSCHVDKAASGHGVKLDCATCHRAHGPNGVAQKPSCTSCHAVGTLQGLHAVAQHQTCSGCHTAHDRGAPRSDRTTCLACHQDRKNHEPGATSCAGCHPFRK